MKDKLFNKFFFTTFCIIIFSLTVMAVILCFFVSDFLSKDKRSELIEECAAVSKIVMNEDELIVDDSLKTILATMGFATQAEIFVTDANGFVKICSCESWINDGLCIHSENRVSDSMLEKATQDEYFEVTDLDDMLSERVYCAAVAVENSDDKISAYVFAVSSASTLAYFYHSMVKMVGLSSILPLVLLFVAEYWQIYKIRKPLKIMSNAARCVARGDFSKRVPVISDDEIGELCVSFNQMTNSLVRLEAMRKSFVANVSHELKTPMTTIGGFIDGIIDGTVEKDQQEYYLKIVSEEVKRMSRLVQTMLSLARLESGETKINISQFNISDTILSILISQEQRIEAKKLNIVGLDSLERIMIKADKDLIHQVVYNLIDNAIKFCDDEGTISVGCSLGEKNVSVSIRNTGAGIPEQELPYVFERFYKIDRSRSKVKDSTGLGLYIVRTIIGVHRGKISVTSVENEYTEFSFTIPVLVYGGIING